ncbi:hypothetical protein DK926_18800 [Rhodococcus sp. Eu-32]|uniref:hypothetical protein n=1 Tax=Rhodococcus sp. Eu-32 TaxID=1017319 RepID=UPI000DF25A3E|nr:hypothetical protein [Rhodococcus sp. Eu-32]RRQ26297.1 hypothetical protein DK926_18800 [Rhodococcus sp. Eu-32]
MKTWSEMTYREQRESLGLWQPSLGFLIERMGHDLARTYGPMFERVGLLFRDNMPDIQAAYALAGAK